MNEKLSRREWNKMVLLGAGGVLGQSLLSSFSGENSNIIIGLQTFSLRDRGLDEAIRAMTELGIKSCELWQGHVEPRQFLWRLDQPKEEKKKNQELAKQWRSDVTMEEVKAIKDKINKAGITIQAYNSSFSDNDSDADIECMFKIAGALGTNNLTTSATVSVMKRADVFAQKYKVRVGMHNHSNTDDPNQFSSPDSFARAMEGLSDYININLDIGHFTAANFNALDFIKENHKKIMCIHIKDRKRNQGENVALGQGDTPIIPVLKLLKAHQWHIPANIEYEYNGQETVAEIAKCLDYCKRAIS